MEKTIIISGRPVPFKSTGAFLLRYKAQFRKDALVDLVKLANLFNEDGKLKAEENFEQLDFEVFFNMAWTMAKTADPSIQTPMEWLDTFDEFPLMDVLPQLVDLIKASLKSSKKN